MRRNPFWNKNRSLCRFQLYEITKLRFKHVLLNWFPHSSLKQSPRFTGIQFIHLDVELPLQHTDGLHNNTPGSLQIYRCINVCNLKAWLHAFVLVYIKPKLILILNLIEGICPMPIQHFLHDINYSQSAFLGMQ